jgi:Bacterial PH domain
VNKFRIVSPGSVAVAQMLGIALLCFAAGWYLHSRSRPTVLLRSIEVVQFLIGAVLSWVCISALNSFVNIKQEFVEFEAPWFCSQSVPLSDVLTDQVRAVDLSNEPGLQPKLRTNGIGVWGYCLGWFRLAGGKPAWLALTDWSRVVLIPTRSGKAYLVSAEQPRLLVAALQGQNKN